MLSSILLIVALGVVAPQDDPAHLLPADTLVYFGTSSVQAGADSAHSTAMAKILGEAEVRAFLHEPTAAAEEILKILLQQGMDMLGQMGGAPEGLPDPSQLPIDLDPSKQASAPPFGQAFFALTHVTPPDMTNPDASPEAMAPDVGLVVGLELLEDGHIAMLRNLWGQIPWPEDKGSHAGVEYLTRRVPESGGMLGVSLAIIGKLAVVSTSEKSLQGIIDRKQSGGEASLQSSADYRKMIAAAEGLPTGGSSHIVRVAQLFQIVQMAIPMIAMAEGADMEEIASITGLINDFGFTAVRMVGGVSKVTPDGRIDSTSVLSVESNSPGLIAKLTRPGESIDPGVLEEFPGNSLSAGAVQVGTALVDAYDFFMGFVERTNPEAVKEIEAGLAQFMGESSLRDDVLANIHGRFLSFSQPGEGLMGAPESIMRMRLDNPDGFVSALGSLLKAAQRESGMPLSLKESDHEGVKFYEIDLSATPLGMALQPAFAVRGGEMVASNSARRLRTYLNGDPGRDSGSLSGNAGLVAFVKDIASKGGIQALGFGDNAANFGTMYGQIVGGAQMAAGMLGDIPVDLSKLPPEGVITQYLADTYTGSTATKDGFRVTHSVGQFQLTDFVPILVVAGLVAFGESQGIRPEPEAPEVDPLEKVQNDLRELKASITVYKISEDDYPESLDDLLRPLADFPEGAYTRGQLPVDAWGNSYYFAMEMHQKKNRLWPKIWSAGENGVDENGDGDDVVKF